MRLIRQEVRFVSADLPKPEKHKTPPATDVPGADFGLKGSLSGKATEGYGGASAGARSASGSSWVFDGSNGLSNNEEIVRHHRDGNEPSCGSTVLPSRHWLEPRLQPAPADRQRAIICFLERSGERGRDASSDVLLFPNESWRAATTTVESAVLERSMLILNELKLATW